MRLVVLFGSRARGDHTESSDYDVLVVDDSIPKDPRRVSNELYLKVVEMFEGDVDAVFMNTDVFLGKLERAEPFVVQIIEEGKVLEKDEEFWALVQQKYREARSKLIRLDKNTWAYKHNSQT